MGEISREQAVFHPPKHKDLAEILKIGETLSQLSHTKNLLLAKSTGQTFLSTLREKCENENFVKELVSAARE